MHSREQTDGWEREYVRVSVSCCIGCTLGGREVQCKVYCATWAVRRVPKDRLFDSPAIVSQSVEQLVLSIVFWLSPIYHCAVSNYVNVYM